jgi:protein ImuB
MLRLQPVEVVSAEALQLPLWGGVGTDDRMRARRALVRVQGLLGPEAVQVPVLSGGRVPTERITLTPFGDEPVPRAPPDRPWPGQLPQPAPAVLLDAPVELLDADGTPVEVTDRGMFTAAPARLDGAARYQGELSWWAGPWPMDAERTACAQVLVADTALLLCYRQQRWYVQGAYE